MQFVKNCTMDKTKTEFIEEREKRGLTQREWANLLDVSYSSVTKWESPASATKPPRHVMRQIRTLDFGGGLRLRLDEITQAKLAKKLAETGKTAEEYLADLLKAILSLALLVGSAWLLL